MDIGARLRDARQSRNLSLRALAEKTGFSASFLSQVELGQASPSLGSLQRIAEALGVTVSGLVAAESSSGSVLRKSARGTHRSEWSKASIESLLPADADEKLQGMLIRLDTGGKTGAIANAPGRRLLAYCTTGSVIAVLSDPSEEMAVHAGDSMLLDGPRKTSWENRADMPAELIVVTAKVA
jgi:XRE family transcriptional regulator, regulator of sulfur utilization